MSIIDATAARDLIKKSGGGIPGGEPLQAIIDYDAFAARLGLDLEGSMLVLCDFSKPGDKGNIRRVDKRELVERYVHGVLSFCSHAKNVISHWPEDSTLQVHDCAPRKLGFFIHEAIRNVAYAATCLNISMTPDIRPQDIWNQTVASLFAYAGLSFIGQDDVHKTEAVFCDRLMTLEVMPGFGKHGIPSRQPRIGLFNRNMQCLMSGAAHIHSDLSAPPAEMSGSTSGLAM